MMNVGKMGRKTGLVPGWKSVFFKITSKVQEMYFNFDSSAHKNWAYDIRTLFSKLGFLEIWHKQEIDRTLLAILKRRIYDQAKHEMYANIENSRKCSYYRY